MLEVDVVPDPIDEYDVPELPSYLQFAFSFVVTLNVVEVVDIVPLGLPDDITGGAEFVLKL